MAKKLVLFLFFLFPYNLFPNNPFRISPEQAREIGIRIWENECAGSIEGLTHWGDGEEFPSFGIGHFIWYPRGGLSKSYVIFDEQFPRLREFLAEFGKQMPAIFQGKCPWRTRKEFLDNFHSQEMMRLRAFLSKTVDLQTIFIVRRFKKAIPYLLRTLPVRQRTITKKHLFQIAGHPTGLYALVDYINFKGEGVKASEQYNGKRWGLLQVLSLMKETKNSAEALKEFCLRAKEALAQRVENAPIGRTEEKWLPGWNKRIDSYLL